MTTPQSSPNQTEQLWGIPAAFTLTKYRLTLQAVERLDLQPFVGNTLRGGFGHTFKRLDCTQPWPCDKYCKAGNGCAYGYIFETAPPDGTEVLRKVENVPRPFVIEPPTTPQAHIERGENLQFELIIIGQAIRYSQDFEIVFRELGRVGLGKAQGKYRLQSMELVKSINTAHINRYAATLPTDRIPLNFLTPTRLKHRGRWVKSGPAFDVLIKALLSRTSSLSYFHCGERLDVDFRGLIDRAAAVNIIDNQTRWEDWSRFSGRQQQRIEMGGLLGPVTYKGNLTDYLPLLALGELIHVGKGTVFGNGQYQIVTING